MQNNGEGDRSTELQAAWRKFESLCNSLENEHNRLQELEKKRRELNENLESLRNDLREAQSNFSEDMEKNTDYADTNSCLASNEVKASTFNADAIREMIRNERKELVSRIQKIDLKYSDEEHKQFCVSDVGAIVQRKKKEKSAIEDDFEDCNKE